MTYVIAGSCVKDDACIEVCPVDCIHPVPGAPDFDVPEKDRDSIEINALFFAERAITR